MPIPTAHVDVAVPVPLRQTFTYAVPPELAGALLPGQRVAVPFGRRKLAGFVLGPVLEPPQGTRIKAVLGLLGHDPVFDSELLGFLLEAARYYLHPIGEVLRAAAPAMPREAVEALRRSGRLGAQETFKGGQLRTRSILYVSLVASDGNLRGARQRALMTLLSERNELSIDELRRHIKDPRGVVRALEGKGLVRTEIREVPENPFFASPVALEEGPTPNEEQQIAIDAILSRLGPTASRAPVGASFLLQGVTGSGKTEVYLRVIARARELGLSALLLVPEIALTPQLVARFRARFGDDIAILHSELGERARDDAWRSLRQGRARIAIGARSALFAPVQRLGVVIVDEEHDGSFKQEDGFRYHARDMALLRAHRAGAVCVLGSATPSLESVTLAHRNRLTHLHLRARATRQALPEVEVVDLSRHRNGPTGHRLLSGPLFVALRTCLEEGGQAILFLNRRGFSPALRCETCGEIQECPACSVSLTGHRKMRLLRCHYCDFSRPTDTPCGACGRRPLLELGLGTEQLEAMLHEAFPAARVARLDRDTASGRGVEAVLERVRNGQLDVLVGTQMVTKGHDLPNVTLVGVVLADQSLAFPDFRASERTFQLLSQVAGRAGRGERPGRVILQTYQPTQPAVAHARTHDFEGFCDQEMAERRAHRYPPFARLAALRVDATSDQAARRAIGALAAVAERHPEVREGRVDVLGPAPAPIARLRARYRHRLLLRSADRVALRRVARTLVTHMDGGIGPARASIDMDPVNML